MPDSDDLKEACEQAQKVLIEAQLAGFGSPELKYALALLADTQTAEQSTETD